MLGIDYDTLNPLKKRSPNAQATLKGANAGTLKAYERETFISWVFASVPERSPDGKMLTRDERRSLAAWCFERRDHFLSECRAFAVEDAITTDRTKDRRTKPKGIAWSRYAACGRRVGLLRYLLHRRR